MLQVKESVAIMQNSESSSLQDPNDLFNLQTSSNKTLKQKTSHKVLTLPRQP